MTSMSQGICVDEYYVEYTLGLEYSVKETMETEFELSNLAPLTYVLFGVRAAYQGRLGPKVYIGQSTGTVHCCCLLYVVVYVLLFMCSC